MNFLQFMARRAGAIGRVACPSLFISGVGPRANRIRRQPSGVFKTPTHPPSRPRSPNNPTITVHPPTTIVPTVEPDLEKGPAVLPKGNPDRETNKNIQPRRTYLPLFLSNFIHRVAGVLLWFIPQSIQRWWSPLHSKRPIGENPCQHIVFHSDVVRPRTSLIACP